MKSKRIIAVMLTASLCAVNCVCCCILSSAEWNCPDDREEIAPDNIIDASSGYGYDYLAINNNSSLDYTVNYGGGGIDWYVKAGFDGFDVQNAWCGFSGFELGNRSGHPNFDFCPEGGKTYAVSARIKNASEGDIIPYFGVSMNNTYDKTFAVYSNEYGSAGMAVNGDDWNDFKATITLPNNYNYSECQGNRVFFGMNKEMPRGTKFQIDCSQKDSFYIAVEKATHIKLLCDKKSEIKAGDIIDIKAEILNQLDIKGNLEQNLKWYCVSEDGAQIIDDAVITPYENGAKLQIKSDGIDTIKIVAESEKYGLVSSIYPVILPENKTITLYAAPNGDDTSVGTESKPLATVKGARDKIRRLRGQGINNSVDVIFKEGKYYFDNTVEFDARDCAAEGHRVTYRAAEGERVVFTGAMKLDLSKAVKVSDESVLSRIKKNVRDKIVEIDLTEQGFPYNLGNDSINVTIQQLYQGFEHPEIYLNSNEQTLAQWPNGNAEYAHFEVVSNDTLGYTEDEPSGWSAAKDWWIGGYTSYDYLYTRHPAVSTDTENKQIKVSVDEGYGMVVGNTNQPKISKRWKAFNLLEELDVPTEWYIDKNTMKLYYYMPQNTKNKLLEISVLKDEMISLNNTDYVSFENIEFENTRGNSIHMTDVKDIAVKGCTFRNIGVNAVQMNGTRDAECDKNYWQRQKLDAAYNCEISDCVFYNIGGHAAVIDGGNVDTLTPGNNTLRNNIFYRCSQKIRNYEAILIKGCGNTAENNNISCCPFIAIRHYGNDHIIRHNEIYNVNQETDDTGAIYCGRNSIQRGTLITENYLHDLHSTYTPVFGHQVGIYWDDNQTGITADRNIIKDVRVNVYTNGVDNTFTNNITVNVATNLDFRDGGAASNKNEDGDTFDVSSIKDTELYYNKYKNLKNIVTSSSLSSRKLAGYNSVNRNYCVGASVKSNAIGDYTMYPNKVWIFNGEQNENVYDNIYEDSTDVFVNPSLQDYRVKNSSSVASKTNVLNESFDIEQIGIISDNALANSPIELVSPFYREHIAAETVRLMWNESLGATSYTVKVGRDAELKDIVAEADSYYNFADIQLEGNGNQYYWKVTAHNNSREFASDWESETQTFINGEKIEVNAVLNENNELEMSAVNNYYKDGKEVFIRITQYQENGRMIAAKTWNVTLDYQKPQIFDREEFKLENYDNTSKIKLFVWDEQYIPLTKPVLLK